jgi:predicted ATPase
MRIERLKVKGFRVLRDVELRELPGLCVLVGANGTGKSTFFDVFAFLRDAVVDNVDAAVRRRGGYRELVTRDTVGPIELELELCGEDEGILVYHVEITHVSGHALVERESLVLRGEPPAKDWALLDFHRGSGTVVVNEAERGNPAAEPEFESHVLDGTDILALKGLGQLAKFGLVSRARRFVESGHASHIGLGHVPALSASGPRERLSPTADNLVHVTRHLHEHHPEVLRQIVRKLARSVPGVEEVRVEQMLDGRILLRLRDGSFKDPFALDQLSDGTLKLFAYLVLLHDPSPHPLLSIEEPENQLYPTLMTALVEELRDYARRGGQVFVSTHSPDLVNQCELDEVFWLEKHDGVAMVRRARDDEQLRAFVAEGDLPGYLWRQGLFGGAHPG